MFKLLSINNQASVGTGFVGSSHQFNYDGTRFYFGTLYSSAVKSIKRDGKIMIVTTRNSIYKFSEEH